MTASIQNMDLCSVTSCILEMATSASEELSAYVLQSSNGCNNFFRRTGKKQGF